MKIGVKEENNVMTTEMWRLPSPSFSSEKEKMKWKAQNGCDQKGVDPRFTPRPCLTSAFQPLPPQSAL